jgi:hypothetical protein
MANIITIKRSSVAGKTPNVADLQVGEIALNLADGIVYSKNTTGNVIVVGSSTTSNIREGSNLYFTNARVYANVLTLGYATNAQLASYATNNQLALYATNAQLGTYATNAQLSLYATNSQLALYSTNAQIALKANIADLTTANVSEVTNLYYTNARVYANVLTLGHATNAQLASYATNNQLALYATNVQISLKANISDLTTSNVTEGTNLYFNNTRAFAAVANTSIILSNLTTTGNITVGSGVGGNITGVNNLYVTNTYSNVIIANVWSGLYTSNVIESTGNIFFTNTRAVSALTPGAGISIAANGLVTSTITQTTAGKILAFALLFGM